MRGATLKLLTATDLHCIEALYAQLEDAVAFHKPDVVALVGDFLDTVGSPHKQLSNVECAERLGSLQCRDVLFVRGNHEHYNWWEFADTWAQTSRPLHALNREAFVFGALVVVGFPCSMGDETAFIGPREPLQGGPSIWLKLLLGRYGPAMRTVWLMHETPTGTPLSRKGSPVAGNPEWNEAIEGFAPWLTISGHDHTTPITNKCWHHRIDQTMCLNLGQSDSGPLHYCVVEAEFTSDKTSLPAKLKINAYPWEQSLTLPTFAADFTTKGQRQQTKGSK